MRRRAGIINGLPTDRSFSAARSLQVDNSQPKILCVSNTSFFLYNSFLSVMKSLRILGLDVVAVAPVDEWTKKLKDEGIRFIPLYRFNRKSANPINDLRLCYELFSIYKREKPKAVLHFTIKANIYGTFAAYINHLRSICTVTGLGWLFTERSFKTLVGGFGYKLLYRLAFSIVQNVVLLNRDDKEFFLTNRLVSAEKVAMIPGQGVNTSRFCPDDLQPSGPGSKLIFLLIARMLWDKGIAEFIQAAQIVRQISPHAEFHLLGPIDIENRAAIPLQTIEEWHAKGIVKYLGKTDDVRPYMEKSTAVVLPSYREGIPTVLLEAMAMGKPIITTDAPGCREVVEDGVNGFLVSPKNAQALADSFLRFISLSDAEKEEMGKNGRERAVSNFDEGIVTDNYIRLIRHALSC